MDRHRLGALLLTTTGIGFWSFLPECVVAIRYVFIAFVVALCAWKCRRCRKIAVRFAAPLIAAAVLSTIFFFKVETGAMIAVIGMFFLVFLSVLQPMLNSNDNILSAAMGAAGIAALIFGIIVWAKCPRLNLLESRIFFSLAAFAGALTLALRPFDRRKSK